MNAAEQLRADGVDITVVDLRTLKPLDLTTVRDAVEATGRLVMFDTCWKSFGIGAEVVAGLVESGVRLSAPPVRLGLPDAPAPASRSLEAAYYRTAGQFLTERERDLSQTRCATGVGVA